MNPENYNDNFFVRGVLLPLRIEEAYKLAATTAGMARWFIDNAVYISTEGIRKEPFEYAKKGDQYEWNWGYKDFKVTGEVLEAEINKLFKVTFGKSYIVTITVEEYEDKVLFKLRQDRVPGEEKDENNYINCYGCWTFFLNNMKSVVEGGIDLRERNSELDELVNR